MATTMHWKDYFMECICLKQCILGAFEWLWLYITHAALKLVSFPQLPIKHKGPYFSYAKHHSSSLNHAGAANQSQYRAKQHSCNISKGLFLWSINNENDNAFQYLQLVSAIYISAKVKNQQFLPGDYHRLGRYRDKMQFVGVYVLQKSHFIRCCVLDGGKSIKRGTLLAGQEVIECISEVPPDWDVQLGEPRECWASSESEFSCV